MIADRQPSASGSESGTVLIIVLWICLGLVTLVYYFAHSASSDLTAAANRVGDMEARDAVEGGIRYAAYVLNNYAIDGVVPDNGVPPDPTTDYSSSALVVGDHPTDPQFWFIGRDENNPPTNTPIFCLVDEASKLNLNTATAAMLEALPMTANTSDDLDDLAQAIVAWRTAQSQNGNNQYANDYTTLDPPRVNKGAAFESTDELRLVYGAALDLIFGEDTNRNGALDPNEDDGDATPPVDNQDGLLEPGVLEYVTAFSSQPTTTLSGSQRVNILTAATRGGLANLMRRKGISTSHITSITSRIGLTTFTSVADFMVTSHISTSDFAKIHTSITGTTSTSTSQTGLVNVNTASEAVLACIPGIGPNNAESVVAYRLANPTNLTSMVWLESVLGSSAIRRAGPYITDQSYRFSADIAAVGRNGRGYHREKVVFDTSTSTPRIIYREDLTSEGWALGDQVREALNNPTSSNGT